MKASWIQRRGFPTAEVEHTLSEPSLVAWHGLEARLREMLGVEQHVDLLSELVRRFMLGRDVRSAELAGRKIKSEALCPASAWLFNHYFDAMLRNEAGKQFGQNGLGTVDVGSFGFQALPPYPKENGFLQAARCAGFDVVRTSIRVPSYVIRDLAGKKISVLNQFTDFTSHIATQASTSKIVTAEMLSLAGMPSPRTFSVSSANHAMSVFKREGFTSAVIKPNSTDRGLGVHTSLTVETELVSAYQGAKKYGQVILQEQADGDDFRILVVDGKIMGVTHRKPFSVVGTGVSTIRELIDCKLKWRATHPFYRGFNNISAESLDIKLMLEKQGMTYESIPEHSRSVLLRSNANVSSGGEHEEVTDICHPDVKQLALDCVALFGLDIAGVDYITPNITKSWTDGSGKICEINPTPALSVDGVPEKLFSRFSGFADASAFSETQGDVMYVRDCSCKQLDELKTIWHDLHLLDLTKFSEKQYFFQSFLATRDGSYLLIVSKEIFHRYGIVNSNVRTIAHCEKCTAETVQDSAIFSQVPYNFRHVFI